MEAGFEDRVMLGTDQAALAQVDGVFHWDYTNDYLTPGQKRHILYNNVVGFLRRDSKSRKVI